MKRQISLLVLLIITTSILMAQPVDTARFRVDFIPQIQNFQKINPSAVINDTIKEKVKFDYYITPKKLDISFIPSKVKSVKLPPDVMKRLYRNFLKLGIGYPVTPLAQLCIHNFDNSKFSYGMNVNHFSSWANPIGREFKKYAYAPVSDTRTYLFFKSFFKNVTLYSSIGYNHEVAHLYGFSKDLGYNEYYYEKNYRDTLKNNFHHLFAEVGIRTNHVLEDKKLKYDIRFNYDFLATYKKENENRFGLHTYFAYDERFLKLSGSQNYRMDVNFDFYNNKWAYEMPNFPYTKNGYKLEFKPTMNFTIKEYHILLGLGVPVVNTTLYEKAKCPLYPVGELQLGLVPGILSIYGGIDGNTELYTLQKLLYENPYTKPNLDSLKFTRTQISVYGGIKGNLIKKLNYHISARYSYTADMPFFFLDTNTVLKNQFEIIYSNANILNVCANLNWQVIDKLYLNLDANFWNYFKLSKIDYAWYKPQFEIAFGGKYYLKSQFIFDLNFMLVFGRKGIEPLLNNQYKEITMKPVLNFDLGFEYLISKQFSAFARINNIGAQYFSKYYDFKNLGINALIGITYSFGDESLIQQKRRR